jgi:hypothetical protein
MRLTFPNNESKPRTINQRMHSDCDHPVAMFNDSQLSAWTPHRSTHTISQAARQQPHSKHTARTLTPSKPAQIKAIHF